MTVTGPGVDYWDTLLGAAGHLGLGSKATHQALGAFGDSFSGALHGCTTIGALGMLVGAAVTVIFIGVGKPSAEGRPVTSNTSTRTVPEAVDVGTA
ncbi:hypothetical protein [Streptomyces sp. NPDC000618]|uniref:hypothetical protein n=1 Tax=Streptomyces sp. NPDC000618 TaxID=3154265 RepID=UPI003317DA57